MKSLLVCALIATVVVLYSHVNCEFAGNSNYVLWGDIFAFRFELKNLFHSIHSDQHEFGKRYYLFNESLKFSNTKWKIAYEHLHVRRFVQTYQVNCSTLLVFVLPKFIQPQKSVKKTNDRTLFNLNGRYELGPTNNNFILC